MNAQTDKRLLSNIEGYLMELVFVVESIDQVSLVADVLVSVQSALRDFGTWFACDTGTSDGNQQGQTLSPILADQLTVRQDMSLQRVLDPPSRRSADKFNLESRAYTANT